MRCTRLRLITQPWRRSSAVMRRGSRQPRRISTIRRAIDAGRHLLSQRLVRPLLVVFAAEALKSPLLRPPAGRRSLHPNAPRVQMAKTMYQDKSMQVRDICQTLRISRSTLYRWIASQQWQAFTPIRA